MTRGKKKPFWWLICGEEGQQFAEGDRKHDGCWRALNDCYSEATQSSDSHENLRTGKQQCCLLISFCLLAGVDRKCSVGRHVSGRRRIWCLCLKPLVSVMCINGGCDELWAWVIRSLVIKNLLVGVLAHHRKTDGMCVYLHFFFLATCGCEPERD